MCRIDDRIHRPKLVDHGNSLASTVNGKFRNEKRSSPILLGRKRPFGQIKRKELKEPAEVVKGLSLSFTEWIDGHAKTRRPLAGKAVMYTVTRRSGASRQTLLFPPKTEDAGDISVKAPCVLNIGRIVIRKRCEDRLTEFCTDDLQPNGNVLCCAVGQLDREQ